MKAKLNKAPAPNRRPRFLLGGSAEFQYCFCASPSSTAAVGDPNPVVAAAATNVLDRRFPLGLRVLKLRDEITR